MKSIENSKYHVDELGNVYGVKGGVLSLQVCKKKGYLTVKISYFNGDVKRKKVHRLVAEAYIPNPDNLPVVNHIDGNKTNNCVDNLEWTTVEYNTWHAANILKAQKGDKATNLTINESIAIKVCEMLEKNMRNMDIADYLGIPRNIVRDIRTRKTWTHISYKYNFIPSKFIKKKTQRSTTIM